MGLYDVVAFAGTRTRTVERWKYGAVAFCWSNFITLGPLAGPAVRFWLYRRSVGELSELHPGIVSVIIAFLSGLAANEQAAAISAGRELTGAIFEGLDLEKEMRAVEAQGLGENVLLFEGSKLAGLAVCHCGAGTEAVSHKVGPQLRGPLRQSADERP